MRTVFSSRFKHKRSVHVSIGPRHERPPRGAGCSGGNVEIYRFRERHPTSTATPGIFEIRFSASFVCFKHRWLTVLARKGHETGTRNESGHQRSVVELHDKGF